MNELNENVRKGGLYSCCIDTAIKTKGVDNKVIKCAYCNDLMVFVNGAWEWKKEKRR